MKIAIWGAGGIGCYYGARLQLAGHAVSYIARGEHLQKMQENGLTVEHETLSFHEEVEALSQDQWVERYDCDDFDLIIIALKANVTEQFVSEIADWLSKGKCPVLSLQNGVENEQLIAEVIGEERTLGGLAVRIGGHIQSPGVVEARGVAQVVFGFWPSLSGDAGKQKFSDELSQTLNNAGIPATQSNEIQRELWRKLLINNGVNPISALTGLDTRQITSNAAYKHVVYQMMQEAAQAGNNRGVLISKSDVDEMFMLISEFDAIKTSMLVDKEKGRPLELDGICGAVMRGCEAGGDQAVMTSFINELLQSGVSY